MDKIARLRQEIERRRDICKAIFERESDTYYQGKAVAYDETLSFLDTLSEEPDKSLEEAAEKWCKENGRGFVLRDKSAYYIGETLPAFKAGAEWQARQLLQGSPMPEDTVLFNKGVQEGRRLERDDMLKDAVEGEVIKTDKHTSVRYKSFYGTDRYFYGIADKQFKPGDKVRIIIVKEE